MRYSFKYWLALTGVVSLFLFFSPSFANAQKAKSLTKVKGKNVFPKVHTTSVKSGAAVPHDHRVINTGGSRDLEKAKTPLLHGLRIINTGVSRSPSARSSRVPIPVTPINRNKVIEYKPLSSEWDKEWIERIDYEVERARHLLNWEDEIDKELQSPEYNVPVYLDYIIEHDKITSLIYVYYEYKPIAA